MYSVIMHDGSQYYIVHNLYESYITRRPSFIYKNVCLFIKLLTMNPNVVSILLHSGDSQTVFQLHM